MATDEYQDPTSYRDILRARVLDAKRRCDELRKDLGDGSGATDSPTTPDQCAELHHHAALVYGMAAEEYHAGHIGLGHAYYAVAGQLSESAASCDASAAGLTLEV